MGTDMGIHNTQQNEQSIENINYNNADNLAKNFTLSEAYQHYGKTLTEILKESIKKII